LKQRPWIFCQLGAREHYVLPRGFHRMGRLRALFTEAWVPPGSLASQAPGPLGRRFADRYAADLSDARVEAFTAAAIGFELMGRLRRRRPDGWPEIMRRNAWFERRVAARMQRTGVLEGAEKPIVFAYSYAALGILRAARAAGCRTVLGQIDPAIFEENIVAEASVRHAELRPDWARAPSAYWDRWREECAIADTIVVNSPWAREGLVEAGIEATKIAVVPLAYEGTAKSTPKTYPERFSRERPLRVLFLGSIVIRKGVAELLEAARRLADAPVEFHFVGREAIVFPADAARDPMIIRHGPASRGDVVASYANADLFILPSLSDGFGLTQIEARANRLPVIASRRCGDVVRDGVDGLLLDEVSGEAIERAVRGYLDSPRSLAAQSETAEEDVDRFSPRVVAGQLAAAVEDASR